MHPLAYIAGTMTQFQGAVLARDQESDDIQIDKCHLRQVQNDPSLRAVDVSPQPSNVVRSNPADQTNRRVCRVRLCLDPQHKMGNPLAVHPYHRRAANVDVCGDLIRLRGLTDSAIEQVFGDSDAKMFEQGRHLTVKFGANRSDGGVGKAAEVIARLIQCEARGAISR